MPLGSTGLGFFAVDGSQHVQVIGDFKMLLRADVRSNVAPGRDRVVTNGLCFIIRQRRIYPFLITPVKAGSAVFTLRDKDGKNILVNMELLPNEARAS